LESILKNYIAEIRISHAVASKIKQKHNITPEQLRSAVILNPSLITKPIYTGKHGFRLFVEGYLEDGRYFLAVLYPHIRNDNVWRLGTAYTKRK
jgi:hypothetical protein